MSLFRRLVPSFAALLAVLVVVQTTDLIACADEALASESSETHTDALASGGHPVPAPGDSHDEGEHEHEEGTFADCLCHVVFTPTGIVPDAADSTAGRRCDWLLVTGNSKQELAAPDGKWTRVWEGNRPADRKEKFRLYRR